MKKSILAIVAVLPGMGISYSQPCSDETARATKGIWQETIIYDYSDPGSKGEDIVPLLQKKALKFKEFFVSAYSAPRGCNVQNETFQKEYPDVDFSQGAGYQFEMSLYYYQCDSDNKLYLNDYTGGTNAGIYVNTFMTFLNNGGEPSGIYEINGQRLPVYMLPPSAGTIKGFKVYQLSSSKAVLFTHDKKLPFKTITQEQYLNALMKEFNSAPGEVNSAVDELEAHLKKQLEEVDQNFEGEMRDIMKKELQNALEEVRKQRTAGMTKLNQGLNEERAEVEKYLSSHSKEDLQAPACVMTTGVFRGFFSEAEGGQYLIIRDENYMKPGLPPDAAQMILVEWNSDGDPIGNDFVRQFEANFPFEKIQSCIDK